MIATHGEHTIRVVIARMCRSWTNAGHVDNSFVTAAPAIAAIANSLVAGRSWSRHDDQIN